MDTILKACSAISIDTHDTPSTSFTPSFTWDAIIQDVEEDVLIARLYDQQNDVYSIARIPKSRITEKILSLLEVGVAFFFQSGIDSNAKDGFNIELKRAEKEIDYDDIIDSFRTYNIQGNIRELPKE